MIEFCTAVKATMHDDDILILAEAKYDAGILNNANWILAPFLAPSVSIQDEFDCNSRETVDDYIRAIQASSVAMAVLQTAVEYSNTGGRVVFGCYSANVSSSHLSCLYDFVEEHFLSDDPEMRMSGG